MGCSDLTAGRLRGCKTSLGGNSTLFLYDFIDSPFTVVGGVATGLDGLTGKAVYKFELEGDSNTLEESMLSDRNTGTRVNTQTLVFTLKKTDAVTSANMNLLAGGFAPAVVKDRNGIYHAIGIDDGVDWAIVQGTGGAKTDLNGYTNTGVATTGLLSPKLDEATITAFEALVV